MRKDDETSKGFGFVNFQHHEDAVKAVESLHGSSLGRNQKIIWCGRAQKKTEREAELQRRFKLIRMERITKFGGINLYIKNLEDDITEDQLKKEFSAFGKIRSLKIMTDEKGNSRGFGFICFDTPEEAQHAMAEMNNRPLQGSTKPLYVALHEPYDIRRQKLAQEQLQRKQNMRPNMLQAVYPPPGYGYPPSTGSPSYVYPSQIVRQQPSRGWTTYPPPHVPYQSQQPPQSQQSQAPAPNRSRQNRNPADRGGAQRPKAQAQRRANVPPSGEPISLEQLLFYPPEQQKILLGEKLYGIISKTQAEKAGKITGMLLDSGWGIEELYSLLESEEKLNQKIEEAVNLLNKQ